MASETVGKDPVVFLGVSVCSIEVTVETTREADSF